MTGADMEAQARGGEGGIATTTNLIRSNGHINGLDLGDGGLLIVRDYDGDPRYVTALPPIPSRWTNT